MKRGIWPGIHVLVLTLLSTAFAVAQNPVPTLSSLSHTSKTLGDDAFTMTVNGGGFFAGSIIRFNGSDRTTTYVNEERVEVAILASDLDTVGTFNITAFNPAPGGGESNALQFSVNNPPPSLSGISPTTASVGDAGFTMTVNGSGFVPTSVVQFDGSPRTTTFVGTSQLTAAILTSDLDTAGSFDVTVFTSGPGGGTSNAEAFTVSAVHPLPGTTSITPVSKSVGDTAFTMTVNGTGFVAASVVRFNGSDRTTAYVSPTVVTATIPGSDLAVAGDFAITVFNPTPGGGLSNAQTFTVNNLTPGTSSLSHTNKTVGDDAFTLTVNGTNFVPGTVVRFNGSDRSTAFVNSARLDATIPATDLDTAGVIAITAFNPAPGGGESNAQVFTINNPLPGISNITPTSKVVGDTSFVLTVNGSGFVGTSIVQFNGASRATVFVNATQLTATILTSDLNTPGTFDVTVTNSGPGGGVSNAQPFTVNAVNPVPTTTGISPETKILNDPGFTLTVNGTNFIGSSTVRFNGSDRATSFVSPTVLTATILATDLDTVGTFSITVFTPGPGGGLSNAQTLSVEYPVPATSAISPNIKAVGDTGFTLTVTGSGFLGQSVVHFSGSPRTTVFVNSTQLTASIPATDLDTSGAFNITVANPAPGGGISNPQTLTVSAANPVPTTTGIFPPTRSVSDSAFTLTVTGTNFVGSSIVRFNGANRTTTFVSPTELTANIPASDLTVAGFFNITVFSPLPGGGESNSQTLTVNNVLPVTTSLSHTSKTVGDDSFSLSVNGSGFVSGSVVRFNGVDRTTTFVNDTRVSADILATDLDTAGTFDITVFNAAPGGGESNATTFTVNNPVPIASVLTPSIKAVGETTFTLTVTGAGFVVGSTVQFNGSNRVTTFDSVSQVRATIPATDLDTAGSFNITVLNPLPGGGTSNALVFTVSVANPVPTTVSIAPTSKLVVDTSFTMMVTGTNFVAGSVVRLNGVDRTTSFVNATELAATILASDLDTAGIFDVTVFNPLPGGGTSNAQPFTVNNRVPTTTTLSHSTKNVGDAAFEMNVNGTNFVPGSVVRFNGSDRVTSFTNETRVFAQILASDLDTAGTFDITVFNAAPGGGESNATTFTVNNPVPIASVLTPSIKAVGETTFTLTVTGAGFVVGSTVQFNGSNRATTFDSASQVRAEIPATDLDTAGSFNITVLNPLPGGGTSNALVFTVSVANPVPTTVNISPAVKSVGDTAFTLTVNGTNFVTTSVVHLNGANRPTTFVNETQLTALIHASDMAFGGTFSITVFNPAPGGGESNAQIFTVNNVIPLLTTLSHTSKMAGDSGFAMEVNGSGFVANSVARFNGSDRPTTFVNDTRVSVTIPGSDLVTAGVNTITVFNPAPGGGVSNGLLFTVNNHIPTEIALVPSSATIGDPGFIITITGTKFIPTSVVRFAGSDRVTTFVDTTHVTASILATDLDSIGTFAVTMFNPAPGGGESNAQMFIVNATHPVPTTTGIVPTVVNAGEGAFGMTVTGTNFVSTSVVRINGSPRSTSFGDSTQLVATILAADVDTAGSFSITVFNPAPGGGESNAQTLTVGAANPVPVIASLSPPVKTVGDTAFSLSVIGSNFISGSVVRIDGSARTTTFVDSAHLTAAILASDLDTAGTFAISVFNPAPGGGVSNSQTFTVGDPNPVPAIISIAPTGKTVGDAGITLDVNGSSFVVGAVARFNGSDRPTNRMNEDRLEVTLFDTDFDTSGIFLITVFNPAPGGGVSNAETLTVNKAGTSTVVVSSLNPSNFGDSVTFTATMTPLLATGSIQFLDGVTSLGTVPLDSGSAELSTAVLGVGGHSITAVYSGDTNYVGSISPAITQTVNSVGNPLPTTTTLNFPNRNVGDASFTMFVNGTNFIASSVIRFDGVDRPTTFVNDTRLQTQVPDSDLAFAHIVSITVFNPAPGGGVSDSVTFIVSNLVPGIIILTPSSKTVGDTTFTLTLFGTNFVTGSVVRFNGSNRSTSFVDDDSITAIIPATDLDTVGLFDVTVFSPAPGGGVSSPGTFTVGNRMPATDSIAPATRAMGDTAFAVTVYGANFVSGSVVRFAGSNRTTTFIDTATLSATITAADLSTAGTFNVTVFTPAPGGGTSNPQSFTVTGTNPAPTMTGISPATRTAGDAAFTLVVTGTNFISGSTVRIEGNSRSTTFVNATEIHASMLASDVDTAGLFNITVLNPAPGGGVSAAETLTVNAAQPFARANVKVFLQGPYVAAGDSMANTLRTGGHLASHFGAVPIPALAVDSITIEIRDSVSAATSTTRKFAPAWLLTNGSIRSFADTSLSYVQFDTAGGNYYIVVRHRNHLAIMSSTPQTLSGGTPAVYDFSATQSNAFGANPLILVDSVPISVYAMYPGDATGNGQVQTDDVNSGIRPDLGRSGYFGGDANLNGQVQNDDLNGSARPNIGRGTQVQ